MSKSVISHYDMLIINENDPFHDPEPLKKHMDKWDGDIFIENLGLDATKTVLEIGVGTGRLASRTAPLCKNLCGIDISPLTVEKALINLKQHNNIKIICGDFMTYNFTEKYDVIYSSLTFMHFSEKQYVINKITGLLNDGGRFVLSIDKNTDEYIDAGFSKIKIYPDTPDAIKQSLIKSGLVITKLCEKDFAHIFVAEKH